MRIVLFWAALSLAATGCSSGKDKEASSEKPGLSGVKAAAKQGPDWSKRAIKPVNDVVDGVAFAVSLPDGLTRKVKKADETFPGYVTWNNAANPFEGPGFTVQPDGIPPKTLDDAVGELRGLEKDRVISVKETLPDGFLVAAHEPGKEFLRVKIWRKYGEGKYVGFSLQQREEEPMPYIDAQRAWFIKVARTFRVVPKK